MDKGLSLYIHIPFCSAKCRYCAFFSVPSPSLDVMQAMVNSIIKELKEEYSKLKFPTINTVYIGGGTPVFLSPFLLNDLLTQISGIIRGRPKEWTIEVNPESLTDEKWSVLKNSDVDRISMGVQSFSDNVLKRIGRQAKRLDIDRALDKLLSSSFNYSIDLIAGLPDQTDPILREDLRLAVDLKPPHLSLYSLMIEEGTPLSKEPGIQDEEVLQKRDEQWLFARNILLDNAYQNYEISNFCQEGRDSLHNGAYWKMAPYLGIGPSAVSTIPMEDGRAVRRTNPTDIGAYLNNTSNPEMEILSPHTLLKDYFLMGLRTQKGVSRKSLKHVFNWDPIALELPSLRSNSDSVFLSSEDRMFMDRILCDIFDQIDQLKLIKTVWP